MRMNVSKDQECPSFVGGVLSAGLTGRKGHSSLVEHTHYVSVWWVVLYPLRKNIVERKETVCMWASCIKNRNFSEYYWGKIISKYLKIKDYSNCMLIS